MAIKLSTGIKTGRITNIKTGKKCCLMFMRYLTLVSVIQYYYFCVKLSLSNLMPIILPENDLNLIMANENSTMVSALSSPEYSHMSYA